MAQRGGHSSAPGAEWWWLQVEHRRSWWGARAGAGELTAIPVSLQVPRRAHRRDRWQPARGGARRGGHGVQLPTPRPWHRSHLTSPAHPIAGPALKGGRGQRHAHRSIAPPRHIPRPPLPTPCPPPRKHVDAGVHDAVRPVRRTKTASKRAVLPIPSLPSTFFLRVMFFFFCSVSEKKRP